MTTCACGHRDDEHSDPGEFPCAGDSGDCWCLEYRATTKTTAELMPGDRVLLPTGIIRTVSHIAPSAYVNSRNEPIVYVKYSEGRTEEWGEGNSAIASTEWRIAP